MVSIPTSTLNIQIPRLTCTDHPKQTPLCILARPVSNFDQQAFTHCLSDPTHGYTQELEEFLEALNPAYQEALAFLENLQNISARKTKKLTSLCGRAASVIVEDLAKQIANLIHSPSREALKSCETKTMSVDHDHFNPRPISNPLYLEKEARPYQIHPKLTPFPPGEVGHLSPHDTPQNIIQQNKKNKALCRASQAEQSLNFRL